MELAIFVIISLSTDIVFHIYKTHFIKYNFLYWSETWLVLRNLIKGPLSYISPNKCSWSQICLIRYYINFFLHFRLIWAIIRENQVQEKHSFLHDQLVAEATTYTTQNKHKRGTWMSSARFEPAIPTIKRVQTYALDGTVTGIGKFNLIFRLFD